MRVEQKTEKDHEGNDQTVVRIYLDNGLTVRVTDTVLVVENNRKEGYKYVDLLYRLVAR